MLAARDFCVEADGRQLLRDLRFQARPGVPLVIIGESGAGKSTLARALLGMAPGRGSGRLYAGGIELVGADQAALRRWRGRCAALVPQAVHDALNPQHTLLEQVAAPLRRHLGLRRGAAALAAADLLASLGLEPGLHGRYPAQCSGGQLQRALLAAALAPSPALLVLDEPTSALDPAAAALVLARLRAEAARRQLVVVTHDLDLARALDGDVLVLYGGCAVETGPAAAVLEAPRHPYTRGLLRAWPREHGKDLQGIAGVHQEGARGCAFANRCGQRIGRCGEEVPALDATGVACLRGGIVTVLAARALHKRLGRQTVLAGLDLDVQAGETVVVVGASGAGKSTLARILVGLLAADAGSVHTAAREDGAAAAGVAYVPQHAAASVAGHFTVFDAVAEPLVIAGAPAPRAAALRALADVRLPATEAFLARPARGLSGGELQRLAIARALIGDPAVLVADEPTAALDASVQAKVLRLLLDVQEARGLALLLITHNMRIARHVADRVVRLEHGRCAAAAPG
ncbi:peptide/nickel transport system ATP-binding protein [Duganella sp. 1411]|uniref:ABC transporter ATP-binding protein n=1 Tax=Duganella sp. 1411 TaxID=2806572 RepID=UPI001AE517CB|nr:oligopeptide/dipeptide ABC transporter ATP-binding protein [Duganella sp. 1411]MBP1205067.1 peptide/nickel transport system ATP-binding protein [Duganella sp. 1411]